MDVLMPMHTVAPNLLGQAKTIQRPKLSDPAKAVDLDLSGHSWTCLRRHPEMN
jgi:hypothetical protein